MTSTLVALVLACSFSPPSDEDVSSANGRFTLEIRKDSLTLKEKGAPRWQVKTPQGLERFYVADSGRWVVALESPACAECEWATLYDAAGKPSTPKLKAALGEEEQLYLEHSTCGLGWLEKASVRGDVLQLTIVQGGNRRSTQGPGPALTMTLDARTGKVTRGPPVPRASIAELVAQHRAEGRPGAAFEALRGEALLTSSRGDAALCAFFASFLDGSDANRRRDAIESLSAARCERELAGITSRPRGDDSDLATFESLQARDPRAAAQYAITALRERRPPALLRARAAVLLIEPGAPLALEAARLAVEDADAFVRDTAVGRLTDLPASQEAFSLLLTAAGRETGTGVAARYGVLRYLERDREGPWGAQLSDAALGGRLEHFPAALVVVGGLAQARGDTAAAAGHYRRALERLEPQRPKSGYWPDLQPWCEAKLQLAQQAAEAGDRATAVRLAQDVLDSGSHEFVAAPLPNRFAGGTPVKTADTVARMLVDSGGAPLPKPVDPADAVRQSRELLERHKQAVQLVKQQREAARRLREEREARRKERELQSQPQ